MKTEGFGKFELLATYAYIVAKLCGEADDDAKRHGYYVAVCGTRFDTSQKNIYADADMLAKAKPSSSIGAADFEKVISRVGGIDWFVCTFKPTIINLIRKGYSFDDIKGILRIPKERGAKLSQREFEENVFLLNL